MKKNILKTCEFVFFFTGFFVMFGLSVNAYIDPSVVTYTIQVGAGIVIAVGAAIGIYYRKAKKKISNKLGIDENKNKEVESDEIFESSSEEKEKTETKEKEGPKETVKKEPKKDTKKKNTKTNAKANTKTKKTTTKKTK